MPIGHHHQVELLKDIIVNHLEDCCGSISECEQLGRLVNSLIEQQEVSPELLPVLDEIYAYCQVGIHSDNLNNHINAHQESLSQWVGHITSYS